MVARERQPKGWKTLDYLIHARPSGTTSIIKSEVVSLFGELEKCKKVE